MEKNIHISQTNERHLHHILAVERAAFETSEEAELTENLLADPSAKPDLSLLAYDGETPVGHILFTHAALEHRQGLKISLLAPLAVIPSHQKVGIGSALVNAGLHNLKQSGIDMVFVLGYPEYYPRFGFEPAHRYGFTAPYPVPEEFPDAWMVLSLGKAITGQFNTHLKCADSLNRPEYWR